MVFALVMSVPSFAVSSRFFEVGYGGGGLLASVDYQREIRSGVTYSGGLGYGVGSGYGVAVVDIARVLFDRGNHLMGVGVNYAMYSQLVSGIPGVSTLSNKNLVGLELLAEKDFGRAVVRAAYNTALGVRISVKRDF